jgi:2-polyprenyl-3-methyl-5-hydroxy-6-metoxy-1,4-benzoquinol methylase
MDLKEEAALGSGIDTHWYYLSKAMMVETHVRGRALRILDVGAGSGWFSRRMLQQGIADHAICVDPGYTEDRDETVSGRRLSFRRSVKSVDADVVLLMDVLEHVADDIGLLSSYVERATPGTRFMITVPAFQFLWSSHDEYLEHHRRYTLSGLQRVIRASGMTNVSSHYYFAAIFPAVLVVRLLRRGRTPDRSDLKPAPQWLSSLLQSVLSVERKVMRFNRVAGLTAVCFCQK